MNQAVYFSTRVINTLQSLPENARYAISNALTSEFLLGIAPDTNGLAPDLAMLYVMVRSYVERDMKTFCA